MLEKVSERSEMYPMLSFLKKMTLVNWEGEFEIFQDLFPHFNPQDKTRNRLFIKRKRR